MSTRTHTVSWDSLDGPSPYAGLPGLEPMQRSIADGVQRSPRFPLMGSHSWASAWSAPSQAWR